MYVCHVDAGHGWLAVKRSELKKLGILKKITPYSYQRGKTVYLEEDCDAGTFLKAKEEKGEKVEISDMRESYREYSPVRSYEGFSLLPEETEDDDSSSKVNQGEKDMATLITPSGKRTPIEPKNGKSFKLDELYEAIGCQMVQVCQGKGTKILIFDEEFLCRGDIARHPTMGMCLVGRDENGKETYTPYLNRLATHAMHPSMGPFTHNVVCGNCIVCESEQFE